MANLSNITGILQNAFDNLDSTRSGTIDAYGTAKRAVGDIATASALAKQQEAIIAYQKDVGEHRAQQNIRTFATAAGTNMDDPSEIVSALGAQMRQAALETMQRQARVNRIESNNDLFRNPLGFLVDFAVGDEARGDLAASQATLDSTSQSLAKLNQATQSTAITQRAIAETTSAATIQAHQQQLAAEATAIAAKGRYDMAQQDINMLSTLSQLDGKGVNYAWQAYQIGRAEEDRIRKAAELESQKASEQTILEQYNAGMAEMGRAGVSSIKELTKVPVKLRDLAINRGSQIIYAQKNELPVPPMVWGSNPIEAVATMQQLGLTPSPAMVDTANKVSTLAAGWQSQENLTKMYIDQGIVSNQAEAIKLASSVLGGTKEQKQEAQNQYTRYIIQRASTEQSQLSPDSNPYVLPPISVLNSDTLIDSSPFLSEFVGPLIDAAKAEGVEPNITPQYLLDSIITASTRKETPITTSSAADDVAAMYRSLITMNDVARGFKALNMPTSDRYAAIIKFGGTALPVNMANPNDIVRAASEGLKVKTASDRFRSAATIGSGTGLSAEDIQRLWENK